jgi:hypothetical protein
MDPVKLANLLAVRNLPGYAVIFEIFEGEVKRLEAEVFNIPPQNEQEVIAAHRVAVGARWTMDEARKKIEGLVTQAVQQPAGELTREQFDELYLQSLR